MAIGDRVRTARKAAGLTQEQLARRTDLTLKAVGELERSETIDPHYTTLLGLSRALNLTIAELVGEEQPALPKAEAPQEMGQRSAEDIEERHMAVAMVLYDKDDIDATYKELIRATMSAVDRYLECTTSLLTEEDGTEYFVISIPVVPWSAVFSAGSATDRGGVEVPAALRRAEEGRRVR